MTNKLVPVAATHSTRLTDQITNRQVSDADQLAGIVARSSVHVVCMASKCTQRTDCLYATPRGEVWACSYTHAIKAGKSLKRRG